MTSTSATDKDIAYKQLEKCEFERMKIAASTKRFTRDYFNDCGNVLLYLWIKKALHRINPKWQDIIEKIRRDLYILDQRITGVLIQADAVDVSESTEIREKRRAFIRSANELGDIHTKYNRLFKSFKNFAENQFSKIEDSNEDVTETIENKSSPMMEPVKFNVKQELELEESDDSPEIPVKTSQQKHTSPNENTHQNNKKTKHNNYGIVQSPIETSESPTDRKGKSIIDEVKSVPRPPGKYWKPQYKVDHIDNAIIIKAFIPNVKTNDIDIYIDPKDGCIVVTGFRPRLPMDMYPYGPFYLKLKIPTEELNINDINSQYCNHVLEIRIPKKIIHHRPVIREDPFNFFNTFGQSNPFSSSFLF